MATLTSIIAKPYKQPKPDKPQSTIIDGGHGYVYLNENTVTKYYDLDYSLSAFRELLIYKKLSKISINIPEYIRFSVDLSTNNIEDIIDEELKYYVVRPTLSISMNKCGINLYYYKIDTDEEMIQIFSDYFGTLKTIHANGISHTDLKGNNLLVMNGRGYVIDFSAANNNKSNSRYSRCFAYNIMAPPEIIDKETIFTSKYDTRKIDSWQMGLMLYDKILSNGTIELNILEESNRKICLSYKFKKIIKTNLDKIKKYKYIKTYKKIILGLLEQDMDERMTCEEAYHEINILCNRTNISRNRIEYNIINDTKLNKIAFPEALFILKSFYDLYIDGIDEYNVYINLDGIETRVALVYRVSHTMLIDGKIRYNTLQNLDIICHAIVFLISEYIYKYGIEFDSMCRKIFNENNMILMKTDYSADITDYNSKEELQMDILRAMTEICAYFPDLMEYNEKLD